MKKEKIKQPKVNYYVNVGDTVKVISGVWKNTIDVVVERNNTSVFLKNTNLRQKVKRYTDEKNKSHKQFITSPSPINASNVIPYDKVKNVKLSYTMSYDKPRKRVLKIRVKNE